MDASVLLVDFDGTLVHIEAPWAEARAEAKRRGLPESVRAALDADTTGEYWSWLDQFELEAHVTAVGGALVPLIGERPWAIVTDNGSPLVEQAVGGGVVPRPTAYVCRRFGRALKPSPAPLLEALTLLDVRPVDALMIGDSALDEQAATAAGVAFLDVGELVS